MSEQIALIGMGAIGKGIAKRLASHGRLEKPLILYNRTETVAETYAAEIGKAVAVKSIPDLLHQSDLIWSCLADDDAVQETYASLLSQPCAGKLFVESSTISPELTDTLAAKIRLAGGEYVAMPVFGDPGTVGSGNMIAVPAGPREAIDRIRPYLVGVTASAVVDFSDRAPSNASLTKLIGNILILTTMEQVAEILVFAEKAGLGTDSIEQLLSALYPGIPKQHSNYAELMVSGKYHNGKPNVGTSAAIALAESVSKRAAALGVQLKTYEVAIQHLRDARNTAGPQSDVAGIYGAVREESGLSFEN